MKFELQAIVCPLCTDECTLGRDSQKPAGREGEKVKKI